MAQFFALFTISELKKGFSWCMCLTEKIKLSKKFKFVLFCHTHENIYSVDFIHDNDLFFGLFIIAKLNFFSFCVRVFNRKGPIFITRGP